MRILCPTAVGLLALGRAVEDMMDDLVPDSYAATLDDLKKRVHAARQEVQRRVNNELLRLWWRLGSHNPA